MHRCCVYIAHIIVVQQAVVGDGMHLMRPLLSDGAIYFLGFGDPNSSFLVDSNRS